MSWVLLAQLKSPDLCLYYSAEPSTAVDVWRIKAFLCLLLFSHQYLNKKYLRMSIKLHEICCQGRPVAWRKFFGGIV